MLAIFRRQRDDRRGATSVELALVLPILLLIYFALIEFGRMIRYRVVDRLERIGMKVTMVDKDLGYELRCADPIPFDAEYTRDLSYGAVKFLLSPDAPRYGGAIISFVGGKMLPLKFDDMINPATQRMRPRLVDVTSETYECARRYMIRLRRDDFEDPHELARFAATAGLSVEEFRAQFEYLVENELPPLEIGPLNTPA